MALNFSHRPIFPEEARQCRSGWEVQDPFDCEGNNMNWENVLPADPFGMDISSTITELLLGADYGGYGKSEVGVGMGDNSFFAGLNFLFNTAIDLNPFPGNSRADDEMMTTSRVDRGFQEEDLGHLFCNDDVSDDDVSFVCTTEGTNFDSANVIFDWNDNLHKITAVAADPDDEDHHPALSFALSYLGVRDLLSVERVCKSLRSTVQNDPLLWKGIYIDHTLNDRITDDILYKLTSRAQGNLQCLSLVECQRVTDDGLKRILECNMRLTKLSVPGCTRLSIDGIVSCLRAFKTVAITGIKYLRIGGLYGVTRDHYEELMSLLGVHNHIQSNYHYQHFYYRGNNFYLSCEDDRPIDIEMCPRCQKYRLVYDCPSESCQGKSHATQLCRGCTICTPRCAQCGKCINDSEYEETFCLEFLCSYCWNQIPKCQDEEDTIRPSKNAVSEVPASSFHG